MFFGRFILTNFMGNGVAMKIFSKFQDRSEKRKIIFSFDNFSIEDSCFESISVQM